jgi:hypothetical protein
MYVYKACMYGGMCVHVGLLDYRSGTICGMCMCMSICARVYVTCVYVHDYMGAVHARTYLYV